MTVFFFILLILIVTMPFWRQWLAQFMQRRMEDAMRRMMGMPSRKEEAKRRKAEERRQSSGTFYHGPMYDHGPGPFDTPDRIVPPEYAEDVEFTEYKDFSSAEIATGGESRVKFRRERQVEDVKFTEIKYP